MKKIILFVFLVTITFYSSLLMAVNSSANQNTTKNQLSFNSSEQVLLYQDANDSKIIAKLSPTVRLVPIFQQKNWVKVGNLTNGQVGWINLEQYRHAQAAYFQPNVQTMFIQVEKDHAGKPTVNVIAYQNGAKLTDQQAKSLYQRIKKQQEEQFKQMERFSRSLDGMFDSDFINMQHLFNNTWYTFPGGARNFQPIVIFPPIEDKSKSKNDSNQEQKNTSK